ncbi:MAG: DMT family transporter [Desulfovibrio sp.]|nr:DMT family transporter [Desulfovibrio sp.]
MRFFSSREEWALCFVTMIWGVSFLVIRLAMQARCPFFFVGLRFLCAACCVFLVALPVMRGFTAKEIYGGLILGILVFLGFGLQTAGLMEISAAKSAFLTAFYIPLVPLFEVLFLRHRVRARLLLGLSLSFPGVLCIAWPEEMGMGIGIGEIETIVCAIVFAWEILVIDMVAKDCNARRLVLIELLCTSLCSFCAMPLVGESIPAPSLLVYGSALGLGLVTAFMQSILTWAQKSVEASRATVIYAGEPVWAGLFSVLAGESIGFVALVGCLFVIGGIVVSSNKG